MKAQKVLTGTVMLMAAFGLAGCAKNSSAPATNESHVRSAKVAKATSHKAAKTDKTAKDDKNTAKASSASSSVASSKVSNSSQSSNAVANSQSKQSVAKATAPAAASQSSASKQSATANSNASSASASSVSSVKSHSEAVQLGLGDTAVWTDNKGVTHHVNSDGLDKQTTQNSNSVSYSDWSGSLPQGVKVEHN